MRFCHRKWISKYFFGSFALITGAQDMGSTASIPQCHTSCTVITSLLHWDFDVEQSCFHKKRKFSKLLKAFFLFFFKMSSNGRKRKGNTYNTICAGLRKCGRQAAIKLAYFTSIWFVYMFSSVRDFTQPCASVPPRPPYTIYTNGNEGFSQWERRLDKKPAYE